MARYFVYCENHGQIGGFYSDPDRAAAKRRNYILSTPGPHGSVDVIEEYSRLRYGHNVINLRKYRRSRGE